jgi:hypothetical protein
VSEDLHSPTTAGPEPTPVVFALPGPLANLPIEEHPEILVGAAFAGGIVAAFILKRFGR